MAYIGPSFIRANKGDLVVIKFTLTVADVPTNLTTPTLSAYEEGNATEFTGGITLTAPYDSKVGLNELQIDTSDAAYTAGKQYAFVFTAGTIGAVTLVGTAILNLALIPEPADIRAVNGGSTGATAGKLELTGIKVAATGDGNSAVELSTTGNATGSYPDSYVPAAAIYAHSEGASDTIAVKQTAENACVDLFTTSASSGYGLYIQSGYQGLHIGTVGSGGAEAVVIQGPNNDSGWAGVHVFGGDGGPAVLLAGGTNALTYQAGDAIQLVGGPGGTGKQAGRAITAVSGAVDDTGAPEVVLLVGDVFSDGDYISAGGGNVSSVTYTPGGTGKAINALGQVLIAPTNTDDSALVLTPNGTGLGIECPVETGADLIESLMLANAANAGKTNGMGTTTAHLRDLADTKNRVTAQVDSNGNRTNITLDLT